MKKIVTAIDLGSNKIAAAAAGIEKDGRISLLGLASMHSRGITSGEITDVNKAVEDISSVMKKLERLEKRKLRHVFITSKAGDTRMDIARGMVPLGRAPREITKRDLKRCLDIAAMVKLPLGRVVVENVVRGFYIDGGPLSIKNPAGLYGMKLEAETFIATANQSKIRNIEKCVDHAGFLLEGVYLSSLSCASSVLSEKEKDEGVLLLDIGESLTETMVFKKGALKSFHVTEKGAGAVLDKKMRADKGNLRALLNNSLGAPREDGDFTSCVVTGGGALIDGAIEEAEKIFGTPARMGIVKNGAKSLNSQDAIIHISTIGLIGRIAAEYKAHRAYRGPLRGTFRKILNIYESYF